MARKRMLDPNFWRDEKIAQCSYMERLLFQGLWSFAEDNGVGRANPLLIKADIFPYDPLRGADIKNGLDKLSSLDLILTYENQEQKYYYIINFNKHQKINRPSQCFLPLPSDEDLATLTEHSLNAHGVLTDEDKLKEDKLKEDIYCRVVSYLNEKAGTKFKPNTKTTKERINARMNEGFSYDDFVIVIDKMCLKWLKDERMNRYLRPETLFGTKFESYLNEQAKVSKDQGFSQRNYTPEQLEPGYDALEEYYQEQ